MRTETGMCPIGRLVVHERTRKCQFLWIERNNSRRFRLRSELIQTAQIELLTEAGQGDQGRYRKYLVFHRMPLIERGRNSLAFVS